MSQPEPLTEQQLDEIAGRAARLYEYATVADPEVQAALDDLAGIDAPALIAEIRRLRAKTRTLGEPAARRESELIARRAELADAEAEKAKLIRWHCEDGTTLDRMRDTIVRLRAEVSAEKAAPAPPVAPLAASQPSEAPMEGETATRPPTGPLRDSDAARIALTRSDLAALLAHHADVLAARWRAVAPGAGAWEVAAALSLTSHANELSAEMERPAVTELLDNIWTFPLEQQDAATEEPAPRRTLTPNEYDAAWHAVEGAAGEEGADPGTVLHAVLDRLGIEWQDAARTPGSASRR